MAFSYVNYTGNGTTTQFSITFTYQNTSEISVTVDGVAQAGLTFPSSSTVQLTSAPASGTLVQVRRTTNLAARAVDFASGSVLTEEDLDDSNIQVFHAAQESTDLAGDSIQLGNDNKWDAQSSVIKNVGTPTASTDAATKGYTDTEVAGVVSSAVTQATAAATTTAQAEVAAATSTIIPDATKLAIHPIGTQYTLSDGVTTDYSSKHYANVASTNATTATNAAATASTDAGTASSAATAAQVAQAAAEAALDTFDDRFLGAKASDPSVDNDGNALLDGAIYFNTTSDIMKVYDQANTIWRDLALTGTDQTNVNLVAGQISPTNNIGTLAGISSDITTVAGNNANVTTVATNIANVNAVGTDIANVNTVATNLTNVNAFADTYFISPTAPASPTLGDLWFDTTNDIMKVYSASGFVNAGSSVNGTANRYVYTATASQTSFAATYDAGYVDVYLNGVKLQSGTDFTATDGANVVLTVGAALNDQIDIVGYGTFNIAIPDISGDATPQLGGNLATSGNNINFGDNDKAIFGAGSDLQIYHDGSHSYIKDAGTGQLRILATDLRINNTANDKSYITGTDGAEISLYHNGSGKLATTATGVAVTGNATFADNGKAIFGAGSDLQIYHDGGSSWISDVGAGNLKISSDGAGVFLQKGATEFMGEFLTDGAVRLYYDNAAKFETTATGVDVTGTMTTDGVTSSAAIVSQTGGSNSAPSIAITSGSLGVNGITAPSANTLGFVTGTAERLRIDSSGNVGIGTASPTKKVSANIGLNDTDGYVLEYSGEAKGGILLNPISGEVRMGALNSSGTYFTTLYANNSEAVRIDSSGNLLVGDSAVASGTNSTCTINAGGTINTSRAATNYQTHLSFLNPNGAVGSIATNGTSTAFNTSSDYRLKENVTADWDATTRLKQLNPVRFNFIADADTTVDGFLAHEVQDIVPEAISGTKDGMRDEEYTVSAATGDIYTPAVEATYDDDGVELTAAVDEVIHSADVERPEELAEGQLWRETTAAVMATRSVPDYQGIDQSKLVPLLVKTIQELEARIAALENV